MYLDLSSGFVINYLISPIHITIRKRRRNGNVPLFMMLATKYKWGGLNWEENNALLESYAKRLKASIRNNDNEACQDACLDILKWGALYGKIKKGSRHKPTL